MNLFILIIFTVKLMILSWEKEFKYLPLVFVGIDEDDETPETEATQSEEMPPLEGDEDDASRMEEVD